MTAEPEVPEVRVSEDKRRLAALTRPDNIHWRWQLIVRDSQMLSDDDVADWTPLVPEPTVEKDWDARVDRRDLADRARRWLAKPDNGSNAVRDRCREFANELLDALEAELAPPAPAPSAEDEALVRRVAAEHDEAWGRLSGAVDAAASAIRSARDTLRFIGADATDMGPAADELIAARDAYERPGEGADGIEWDDAEAGSR